MHTLDRCSSHSWVVCFLDPKETLKTSLLRKIIALQPAWLQGCIFRERIFQTIPKGKACGN